MRPYPLTFYVYAVTDDEVKELQDALYEFVRSRADQGIAVTARKMVAALHAFGDNPIVNKFLI